MEENKEKTNDYANYYGSVGMCMSRVDECIGLLVEALKESPEYQKYQEMRGKIHQNPEKERQVNEFRKRAYLLQNSREQIDLFNEIDRLQEEAAPLQAQPDVSEYLAAELALCRMVQHINYRLMQEIDFD
mgnify:CR=1 FL=1